MAFLKNYLLNLNLFKPPVGSNEIEDDEQHRSNIIATRVYLVVLTLVLIIVAFVSWLTLQTTIVTLQHPTKEQYEVLPPDARCPCSRISLSYGEFTSLQASFHQVCSSDFVSDRFIEAIFSGSNSTYFYLEDFRTFGSAQFQALAGFCRLSKASVLQSIASFDMTTLIDLQLLSETALRSQTNAYIAQFQLTAPNTFGTQLQLVRELTKDNQLMTGLQTQSSLTYYFSDNDPVLVQNQFVSYYIGNTKFLCMCSTDLDCNFTAGIYDDFGSQLHSMLSDGKETALMTIPGILGGCMPVDSILLSTLECFYNQMCLDELISFFPTTERFTAMTILEQSNFKPNSTVKSMVDRLMVEEWMPNISYDKYYAQCAPISCTYLKVQRHDFVFVLTTLISLLSGLTIGLEFLIPIVIRFIMQRLRNSDPTPRIPRK